jgi:hypothetical protein
MELHQRLQTAHAGPCVVSGQHRFLCTIADKHTPSAYSHAEAAARHMHNQATSAVRVLHVLRALAAAAV